MMTAKATAALLVAYGLALAAGTTSGVLAQRLYSPASGSSLAAQLQLSDVQSEQMRKIWQSVQTVADDCYNQAQVISRQRDQALVDLLTDQQKAKFAKTDQAFAGQFAELAHKRDEVFRDAFARTEALLTPQQRTKYEQVVKERLGHAAALNDASQPSVEELRP